MVRVLMSSRGEDMPVDIMVARNLLHMAQMDPYGIFSFVSALHEGRSFQDVSTRGKASSAGSTASGALAGEVRRSLGAGSLAMMISVCASYFRVCFLGDLKGLSKSV